MSSYRLTFKAEADLLDIARYTIHEFGIKQARTYKAGLNRCFMTLADNPGLGRDASEFSPNLKRFSYKSHVIFYVSKDTDILIIRVLGQMMDFERHL